MKILALKPLGLRKLGHSSDMENYALMHHADLKGFNIQLLRSQHNDVYVLITIHVSDFFKGKW